MHFVLTIGGSRKMSPTAIEIMTRTLIVIDDNKSVRESLRFLLMRRGYAVLEAENGPNGIALVEQNVIDGALVDVNMPGMNGIAVCRALREHAARNGRSIAVWLMTGARTNDVAKAAAEAGALLLLQKPFDIPDLMRRIEVEVGAPPPAQPGQPELF
jgi:CheY-like chemotaxis protein